MLINELNFLHARYNSYTVTLSYQNLFTWNWGWHEGALWCTSYHLQKKYWNFCQQPVHNSYTSCHSSHDITVHSA